MILWRIKRDCRQFPTSPDHRPSNFYSASRYFSFHHQNPFFFQHQAPPAPANAPSDETDDDDSSSVVSIETKPSTTSSSSLVKHSIENILSNKVTIKTKRPLSSSSICTLHWIVYLSHWFFSFSHLFSASNDWTRIINFLHVNMNIFPSQYRSLFSPLSHCSVSSTFFSCVFGKQYT